MKELPGHVILRVAEYVKKIQEKPRIIWNSIVELTRLGCFIMSSGYESNLSHLLLSNTSTGDYEKLPSICTGYRGNT